MGKIAFAGTRSKRRITGTYTVMQSTGAHEKGTITLDRISPVSGATSAVAKDEPTAVTATLPDVRLPESVPAPRDSTYDDTPRLRTLRPEESIELYVRNAELRSWAPH